MKKHSVTQKTQKQKKDSHTLSAVKQFIDHYSFFYVLGHEKPDGDCIGSQLAMSGLLTTLHKDHVVLSPGPFTDSISRNYQPQFTTNLNQIPKLYLEKDNAALILLDVSTPDRMGKMFAPLYSLPAVIIDHHASVKESFGKVRYIEPNVPANTLLIYRLYKEYGIAPTQEQAYYILLGILTDTQFFRFVKKKDPEALIVAAEFIELGVTPAAIYQQISYGYTFYSRKVISKILDRAHRVNNNRIIITYISFNDYFHSDDIPQSYEIYQMLEGTHKVEIVVYIQEVLNDRNMPISKVGMRSRKFNVGNIAKLWYGGGHPNAAGFTLEKPLQETIKILTRFFDTLSL